MSDASSGLPPSKLVCRKQRNPARTEYKDYPAPVIASGGAVAAAVGLWIGSRIDAIATFLDLHVSGVGAFAALMAAVFAYALWKTTVSIDEGGQATLTHLRESSQREHRAYVFVFEVTAIAFDDINPLESFAYYAFVVKNSGRTPAYDVTVISRVDLAPPNVGAMAFPELPHDTDASRAPLGPDSTVTLYLQHAMWTPAQRALLDAGHVPYLHGIIRYEDAFGEKQWTTFRHVRDQDGHGFTACEQGNDAKRTKD
jgi:hypothetical protein